MASPHPSMTYNPIVVSDGVNGSMATPKSDPAAAKALGFVQQPLESGMERTRSPKWPTLGANKATVSPICLH